MRHAGWHRTDGAAAELLPGDFSIAAVEDDEKVNITVVGELDVLTAGDLATLLAAASDSRRDVVVNVSAVSFADSAALSVLVRAHTALGGRGRRLIIRDPSEPVQQVLELSGLARVLHIERAAGLTDADNPALT